MHIPTLIARKREGEELSAREIAKLIDGYTRGEVPDYQMSAFAMAVERVPTNKHCFQFFQIALSNRAFIHPADWPSHVAFMIHPESRGHPAIPDAGALPDQRRDRCRFLDPLTFAIQLCGHCGTVGAASASKATIAIRSAAA